MGDDSSQRRVIKAVEYSSEADAPDVSDKGTQAHTLDIVPKSKKIRILPLKADRASKAARRPNGADGQSKAEHPYGKRGTFRWVFTTAIWPVLKPVCSILIGICIVALVGVFAFKFVYKNYFSPVDANSTEQIEVVIKTDDTLNTIANKLEDSGIIRNSKIFKYYVDFSDMSSKLLAGKFSLSPSMTFEDIISVLKRPSAAANTTRVTFAEGISIETYATLFTQEGVLKNDLSFIDKVTSGEDYTDFWFIQEVLQKEATQTQKRNYVLEGYLFPNTYDFYISSTEDQAIEKLLEQFNKVFTDDYKARAEELNMSVDDVIILASMIEKEAKQADFKKVSAVFYNRLKTDMPLQSCATMQYFMPEKKLVYNTEELKTD